MARPIYSRLDDIERRLEEGKSFTKFDVHWMVNRLRKYEEQLILATEAVEISMSKFPRNEDPTTAGHLVKKYIKSIDMLMEIVSTQKVK